MYYRYIQSIHSITTTTYYLLFVVADRPAGRATGSHKASEDAPTKEIPTP